jgi:hypothetical protein
VPTNGFVSATGISCGAGGPGDCTQAYASGTTVTLTGNPASGFQVGTWTGCTPINNNTQCTVAMTQARPVTVTFVATPPVVFLDGMQGGPGGWVAQFPWALTTEAAHSGAHSWTDSPGGNYGNSANVSLFSPVLDLSGRSSVTLTFWHRYDLEPGFDFANVWVTTDGGATYVGPLAQFTGTSTVWTSATVDLSPFAGQPTVQIAFQVFSNSSITRDGWYIDDVVVAATTGPLCQITLNQPSYRNGDRVEATMLRVANIGTSSQAVELKIWLKVPGLSPWSVLNVGADGSVVLPAGFTQNLGPATLFTLDTSYPRGDYELSCRLRDPVTGELLSEDRNPFNVR